MISVLYIFWYMTDILLLFGLQNFPEGPIGQFDQVNKFVRENFDISKWVGLAVLILQVIKCKFCILKGHVSIGEHNWTALLHFVNGINLEHMSSFKFYIMYKCIRFHI